MPSIDKTLELLKEFKTLPVGWHFGEGNPVLPELLKQARAWVKLAGIVKIKRANAFPGVDGSVQIRFYHDDRIIEMTFETDRTIVLAEDAGKTQIYFNEDASLAEIIEKLKEFAERVCFSSEQFTNDILTTKRVNLPTQSYRNRAKVFPFSMPNVPKKTVVASAPTYPVTIPELSESQQSIWHSRIPGSWVDTAKTGILVSPATNVIATSLTGIRVQNENLLNSLSWTGLKYAAQMECMNP